MSAPERMPHFMSKRIPIVIPINREPNGIVCAHSSEIRFARHISFPKETIAQ
jgi:hypothetical protein